MNASPDVVVVGAGIVGAACAAEFQIAGLRVTAVDPMGAGSGATAAAMGHIALMHDSEAQFALTCYSQQLWRCVAPRLPEGAQYRARGALWIASSETEMPEIARKQEFLSSRGVPLEILDSRGLAEAEPHLRAGIPSGILLPGDAIVNAPEAAAWLLRGSELRRERVVNIRDAQVRLESGETISAGAVVVATGIDAARLLPELHVVQPRKGHLLLTGPLPGLLRHQVIELGYSASAQSQHSESVAFNVQPRPSGEILIGSSRQYGVFESKVEQRIVDLMLRRAREFMPKLEQRAIIRAWTGFRAATSDKLPLIGPMPGYPGIYVATGHEGLGISTSLATGKLLADTLLGRPSAIDRSAYLPDRHLAPEQRQPANAKM